MADMIQNPANAFQQGMQAWQFGANIAEQQRQRQMQEQQQQRAQQYKDMLTKVISNPASTAQDYLMLQAQFPEQAKATKDLEAQQSDAENKNDLLVKMQLLNAVKSGDKESLNRFASQQIEAYKNSGRDTKAQGLQMILDQYENVPPEVTEGSLVNSIAAQMDNPKDFIDYYDRLQARAAKTEGGAVSTQKSEILPDGTSIQIRSNGDVIVKDPENNVLKGKEASSAIVKAKNYGVQLAKDINFNRETGKWEGQQDIRAGVEAEVTRGKEQAKGEEGRVQSLIERGSLAAESTAGLRRGIQLLDQVKTGGPRAVGLRVKQLFGIETADEGELSNQLSKAVLSQLRETFGAAFTENEGRRLERIEASFTKSPATNKRLLQQSLQIAERTAKRAREAARKRGDMETVNDIDNLLKFSLSEQPATTETPTGIQTINTQAEYDALPSGAEFIDSADGKKYRKP